MGAMPGRGRGKAALALAGALAGAGGAPAGGARAPAGDLLATGSVGPVRGAASPPPPQCGLDQVAGHKWTWVPPEALTGSPWNSEHGCVYEVKEALSSSGDPSSSGDFEFSSPAGCLTDRDLGRTGGAAGRLVPDEGGPGGGKVELTYRAAAAEGDASGASTSGNEKKMDGWFGAEDCSLIDMADGGMYVRGHPGGRDHPMDFLPHEWLRVAVAWVMRASMIVFPEDGSLHLSPGIPIGPGLGPHYDGQYARDAFYGISNAWPLVNATRRDALQASSEWWFARPRSDGLLPMACHINPAIRCVYGSKFRGPGIAPCDGAEGAAGWRGCQVLDTAPFAMKTFGFHFEQLGGFGGGQKTAGDATSPPSSSSSSPPSPSPSAQSRAWYDKWLPTVKRSLEATTRDPAGSGTLWSNPTRPMIGYGFQDNMVQTGTGLYPNLLLWNATGEVENAARAVSDAETAAEMGALRDSVRAAVNARLWDEEQGIFRASDGLESGNVDVWGNAMAGAPGGLATEAQSRRIFKFFAAREADLFYEGQVRQIPFPTQWTSTGSPDGSRVDPLMTVRSYQNGGFWATPLHHVLPFLAQHDRAYACRVLGDAVASFRGKGIWEWVGPFFPAPSYGAPGYVASAANAYFASEHLRCWEEEEDVKGGKE